MMRRMAIWLMALALLVALCACGGQLEGAMELDREGKGKRTVAVTLQNSELEQVVTGGIEGVEPVIDAAKPEWLLYAREDTEKGYILRFTVPFSDIETYRKRCETLTGKEVKVEMAPAEGAFGEGFLLKEDFTTDDLLNWLREAMKKEFPSKAKAIDQLTYTKKPTSVAYEGVVSETSGSGAIAIDKRVQHAVDSLSILTGVEGAVWRREVQLGFTGKSVESIGERLDAEIEKLVPQGGTLNREADGDGALYRIAVEAETPELLSAATARMLGADTDGGITSSITGDMPFVKAYAYKESFDASALLPAQDAKFSYRFETDSTLLLSEAGFQGESGNWHQALTREGGGYSLELPAKGTITLEGAYAYEIQKVSIQTERSGNTATRWVLFTLAADVHRAIGEGLNGYLETRLPIGGELIDPYRGDTGTWTYGVVYTGEIESLATFMANFSGSSTNTLAREELGRKNLWTRTEQWTEHIDLSRLLKDVTVGEGIEYAQTLGRGREADRVLLNGAQQDAGGGAFSVKTVSPVFDVVTETLSPDLWFYVGAGVGALLVVVIMVLIARGLVRRRRRSVVKLGPGDIRVVDPGGWNPGQAGLVPMQAGGPGMQGMQGMAAPGAVGPGGVPVGETMVPGGETMVPGGVTTVPGAASAMFGAAQANVPGGTTMYPPAYAAPGQGGGSGSGQAGMPKAAPPRRPMRSAAGGVARFFMGLIPRFAQVFVMLALLVWLLPFAAFTIEVPENGGWSWAEQVLGESATGLLQAASGVSSAQGWWNNMILGGALGENAVTFSGLDLARGKELDPAMPVAEGVLATRLEWTPVLVGALGLTAVTFLMILFWPNRYRVKWLTTILCSGASVGLLWLFRNGLESGWIQPLGAELEARLWLGYPITILLLIASAVLGFVMLLLCRFAHRIEKERWERIIQKENAKGYGRTIGA